MSQIHLSPVPSPASPHAPESPRPTEPARAATLLRLLSAGRFDDTRQALSRHDPDSLLARCADADMRLRAFDIGALELRELRDEAAQAGPAQLPLRYWLDSLLVERLMYSGDPACFEIAERVLTEMGDEALPGVVTLYARARLRRAISWLWLFEPLPAGRDAARQLRDGALQDLDRAGLREEAVYTRAFGAGLHAALNLEDINEAYAILVDAAAILAAGESSFPRLTIDCLLGLVSYDVGDIATAERHIGRVVHEAPRSSFLGLVAGYMQALVALTDRGGDDELRAVDRVLVEFARIAPAAAYLLYRNFAWCLAELDHPAFERYAQLSLDLFIPALGFDQDREPMMALLAIAAGDLTDTAGALPCLERMAATGHPRRAGRLALIMARTAGHSAMPALATGLRDWAVAHLPDERRRIDAERRVLAAVDQHLTERDIPTAPPAAPASDVIIRVLEPELRVEVHGRTAVLTEALTRLLLMLALAHPAPVHVEAVSDRLWPGEPLAVTRRRLNSLVHRLREALAGADGPVLRWGDTLRLDRDRCQVDLDHYRQALRGGDAEQVAALAGVHGLLCHAQLPYDEELVARRHAFAAEWEAHARRLLRAGAVQQHTLEPAMAVLGLDEL